MFRDCISDLPLTSNAANVLFKDKIWGDKFNNDNTFLATLRAVIAPRMEDCDKLHLRFPTFRCAEETKDLKPEELMRALAAEANFADPGCLTIFNLAGRKEYSEAVLKTIETAMEKSSSKLVKNVTDWANQSHIASLVYEASEIKSALMFVCGLDITRVHILQAVMRNYLPWFFEKHPINLDDIDGQILKSLSDDTSARYIELIAKAAEQYDFRSAEIREKLAGFEARHIDKIIENTERQIEDLQRSVRDYYRRAGEKLSRVRELQMQNFGAKVMKDEKQCDELMEYFLMNKHLILENVGENIVRFVYYGGYMDMWDEDSCKRAIDNKNSDLYYHGYDVNGEQLFYKALFIDQSLKLRMCGAYEINMNGDSEPIAHYGFPVVCKNCMPNPHSDYTCLGGHASVINEAVQAGNFVMAVEQCCAAARNLNFVDTTVMRYFEKRLFDGTAGEWVELPDGTSVTPLNAIKYLKEKKGA